MTEPAANPQAQVIALVDKMRKQAKCIYLAVDEAIADDIAGSLNKAADFLSCPAADRGQIVEDCARVVKARADFWNKQARADFMWTCSESLADECEDIYSAIRALAPAPAQTEE